MDRLPRAAKWVSSRMFATLTAVKTEIVAVQGKEGGMRDVGTAKK